MCSIPEEIGTHSGLNLAAPLRVGRPSGPQVGNLARWVREMQNPATSGANRADDAVLCHGHQLMLEVGYLWRVTIGSLLVSECF
jgi:hypothetical protein